MNDYLFPRPAGNLKREMTELLELVDSCFPIPGKHRSGLPRDVLELSRSLTDQREARDDGYLGKASALSAYLRYFLPWNIFRLSRLLPALDLPLKDGDTLTDLGSGPLTFPIALYLSRPDLRGLKLEFRCVDRTAKVLETGKTLFEALIAGSGCPWKVRTIRGSLGTKIEGKPAALVTAINVLNELFWDDRTPIRDQAAKKAQLLASLSAEDGAVLVVEPGIPRSAQFVSALRGAFIADGYGIAAPCTHHSDCPFPGGRGQKWCHFAFGSEDAPERLHKLSASAGIPKERATLSFLLTTAKAVRKAGKPPVPQDQLPVRVISDSFPLTPGNQGRYACSERGLVLISGKAPLVHALESGTAKLLPLAKGEAKRDQKSGALEIVLR